MPEQFSLSHVESIHRVFHGKAALPCCRAQLEQFNEEYILFQPHSYAECFKLAATFGIGLYRNKPYGLQTPDTAIVTALVILRVYGITIEAGANHQLYERLITLPTIDSYAATLRECSIRVPPDFAFSSETLLDEIRPSEEWWIPDRCKPLEVIKEQTEDVASNYLINPLYGFVPPKRNEMSIDECIMRDEDEIRRYGRVMSPCRRRRW